MTTFKFYGAGDNHYKLNDIVWEAIEDPKDGYRSYLKTIVADNEYIGIFYPASLAEVYVREVNRKDLEGYEIVDVKDEWVWLEIGTRNPDDHYPGFVFNYHPKPSPMTWKEFIS